MRSGLLFRIALFFLKTFPATQAGQVLALLTSGVVVTSLVPLAIARVATVAPLTHDLMQSLGYPPRSRASAALAFAGLLGYGAFSSIFLTGLAMNFFVINLIPQPDRVRFDWLTWLKAAGPAGAVIFAGAVIMLLVLFRSEVEPKATPGMLRRQERVLGPLSRSEMVTVASLAVLLTGLVLQHSYTLIAHGWRYLLSCWLRLAVRTIARVFVVRSIGGSSFSLACCWAAEMSCAVWGSIGGLVMACSRSPTWSGIRPC